MKLVVSAKQDIQAECSGKSFCRNGMSVQSRGLFSFFRFLFDDVYERRAILSPMGCNARTFDHGVNRFHETSKCDEALYVFYDASLRLRMGDTVLFKSELGFSLQISRPSLTQLMRASANMNSLS